VLFILFLITQASLWGERGLLELWSLHRANAQVAESNAALKARNQDLIAQVYELRQGGSVLEEQAREALGMVRPDETFFRVLRPKHSKDTAG